jgi:hypothetical protein
MSDRSVQNAEAQITAWQETLVRQGSTTFTVEVTMAGRPEQYSRAALEEYLSWAMQAPGAPADPEVDISSVLVTRVRLKEDE